MTRSVSYGLASGEVATIDSTEADSRGITVRDMRQLMVAPETHLLRIEQILAAAADDRVHPVIGRIDPLRDAAHAHAAFEARQITGSPISRPLPPRSVRAKGVKIPEPH